MRICGIVCEYNPFHNGHAYHIAETRARGVDGIVCVMSGDFVQRGEPALLSKHDRAEMALLGGADLVLELPSAYALSSSERFASGAVSILSALGVVDSISFGCEAKSLDKLKYASKLLKRDDFYDDVKERMKSGISFATARDSALKEISPECAEILRAPNNLLAVEYLRALPDSMDAITIERFGVEHDSSCVSHNFASASAIREMILDGNLSAAKQFMPDSSYEIIKRAISDGAAPVSFSGNDRALLSYLKRLSPSDWRNIPDVNEGLDARLYRAVSDAANYSEIADNVKTKRYAHSRIRRILLSAFLDIKRSDTVKPPCFTRVLACNDRGRKILSLARKNTRIPIITKPASAKELPISAEFEAEVLRSSLYSLLMPELKPRPSDWKRTPIIKKEDQ